MTSVLLLLVLAYAPRALATAPQPMPQPPNPAAVATPPPLRCQQPDGKPLPTATSCSDIMAEADCKTIFPTTAPAAPPQTGPQQPPPQVPNTPAAATRPPNCDNPGLVSVARQCAKTCMICCETVASGCQDDPTFGIDCAAMKYLCQDPSWTPTMSKACGATCGLCAATSCKDQIGACAAMKTMCRDITQQAFMKQNCARTCGFCADLFGFNGGNPGLATGSNSGGTGLAGGCVDNASGRGTDCASRASYCNFPVYQQLMRQECPRTCGFCS